MACGGRCSFQLFVHLQTERKRGVITGHVRSVVVYRGSHEPSPPDLKRMLIRTSSATENIQFRGRKKQPKPVVAWFGGDRAGGLAQMPHSVNYVVSMSRTKAREVQVGPRWLDVHAVFPCVKVDHVKNSPHDYQCAEHSVTAGQHVMELTVFKRSQACSPLLCLIKVAHVRQPHDVL